MMPFARAALLPLVFPAVLLAAEGGMGLPKASPFVPVASSAPAAAAASENIEFAGVSSIGKKTDLIFYDKAAKKTHWIAVGETREGIAVLSYDEQRDQATVKVNGVEKVFPLRKGARPPGGPRPVPTLAAASGFSIPSPPAASEFATRVQAPPAGAAAPDIRAVSPAAPAPPATPEAQAQVKAETEARMLVSDLLEIGMAQRKAYEEAQKKAAEGAPPAPAAPAPEAPRP